MRRVDPILESLKSDQVRTSGWFRLSIAKRAFEILFTVWIAVITARYVQTVAKSIVSPFNPGSDAQCAAVWLAAVAVIAVCLMVSAEALRALVKIAVVALTAIAILSGVWAAALLSGWFLLIAYVWGKWLLRIAGIDPEDRIERLVLAIPLGLLIPAMAGFILACFHLLKPASVWILIAGLSALQWRTIGGLRWRNIEIPKTSLDAAFPLAAALPVVLMNFIWAVAPEIHFDANNYHLAVPKIWLENGGFVNQPYLLLSYLSHLNEMVFTFVLGMGGPAAAKLLSFALSLLAAGAAYALGKEVFDARVGCWAAAFFYTTPIASWLAGTAYTDDIVALYITASILAFAKWYRQPASAGWMYASGALAGIAIAAKMNAAFGLPVLIGAACWNVRRVSLWRVVACLGVIAAVTVPWYAVTYYWTGNPFLPMLNGVFKSSMWEQNNHILNSTSFGVGTSPASLIRLPFRFIFNTDLFGEASPRGGAGIALLIAFPFAAFLISRKRPVPGFLVAALGIYFVIWALTLQYCRYFAHILPVVSVLAVATVFHFGSQGIGGRARIACLGIGMVAQFAVTPVQYWAIPERYPARVALGLETREHFLDRALLGYTAARRLNGLLKKGDRVIGAGVEQIRYYLDAPLETLEQSTVPAETRALMGARPDEALLRDMRNYGFAYILASKDNLQNPSDQYPYLKTEFLSRFATLEYSDNLTVLYRLK